MPDSPADFTHHGAQLLSFVERRLKAANDAEDVVQESFLRAMVAERAAPIGNVRAYLYRIAANLSVDTLRHKSVRERRSGTSTDSVEALAVASPEPSAEQIIMARQRKAAFDAALAELPDRQRQALILNRLEGWPYPRIAAHLGCSPNTIYNDIKAAMKHILARTADIEL